MHLLRALVFLSTVILLQSSMARADAPCQPDWTVRGAHVTCPMLQDIVTGQIQGGETVKFTLELQPGEYSFAAWASLDVVSLGMTIRDASMGSVIKMDDGADNSPICEFTLASAKSVEVSLAAGDARISGAAATYYFAAASGSGCFVRQPCRVKQVLDEWTVIVKDEGWSVMNWEVREITSSDAIKFAYSLPAGEYTAIAETLNPLDDVDMYIKRGSDTILTMNQEPDNSPLCDFELSNPAEITVEIDPFSYTQGQTGDLVVLLTTKTMQGQR